MNSQGGFVLSIVGLAACAGPVRVVVCDVGPSDEARTLDASDASGGEPDARAVAGDGANEEVGGVFIDVVPLRDVPTTVDGGPAVIFTQLRESCPTGREARCEVVRMPRASFRLGSGRSDASRPPVSFVRLSPYRMDRYEVTVARFRRYVAAGMPRVRYPLVYPGGALVTWREDAQTPQLPRSFDMGQMRVTWTESPGAFEDHPINNVTVATAQAFCAWDGGRLPTEAQWEYAAFHHDALNARVYPHGDTVTCGDAVFGQLDACPIAKGQVPGPVAVGSRPAERLFYDLGGNVQEFTADIGFSYSDEGRGWNCLRGYGGLDPICVDGTGPDRVIPARAQVRGSGYLDDHASTVDDRIDTFLIVRPTQDQLRSLAMFASPLVGFRCAYED